MNIAIINSAGFWPMGWATDKDSQQDVIKALQRLGAKVVVTEVANVEELNVFLTELKQKENDSPYFVWPNAYEVFVDMHSSKRAWLADEVEAQGFALIGNNAKALRNVMSKSLCQSILAQHSVAIPTFISAEKTLVDSPQRLQEAITDAGLSYPLFVKPHNLSTSKGITQHNVVSSFDALYQQLKHVGENFGFPVMVEEYLPGQDITVSVFMSGDSPTILPTYYDTKIHDDPGAVLDHDIRMRDWDDGKWLRVVKEPEVVQVIYDAVVPAAKAVGIEGFTRIDCRFDRNGVLKVFDVNGLPGLELPFSTTVWQMIVKLHEHETIAAFDTLISLILYCAALHNNVCAPEKVTALAETFISQQQLKRQIHNVTQ